MGKLRCSKIEGLSGTRFLFVVFFYKVDNS